MKNCSCRSVKTALLFTSAFVVLGLSPFTALAQQTTSGAADLADNSVDPGDIVAGDYAASPTIRIDDATTLTINTNLANPNNGNNLISIDNADGVLVVSSGVDISASGTGDVINATNNNVRVDIHGTVTASANTENAINFNQLLAGNSATINVYGGAGTDGTVTGWITGGAGDDTMTLDTSGGDLALIGGEIDLKGGADTVNFQGTNTATVSGSTFISDTINMSGTGTLDIQSTTTTGNVNFTQDGTIRLGNGQTLNGHINNTAGGAIGTVAVNGGTTLLTGRLGGTNALKLLELNGGTTRLTHAGSGDNHHQINTIMLKDDAILQYENNDANTNARVETDEDGTGSIRLAGANINIRIHDSIGSEDKRLGLIQQGSTGGGAFYAGGNEIWADTVRLVNNDLNVFAMEGNTVNVRVIENDGVNHRGRLRFDSNITLITETIGTDSHRMRDLWLRMGFPAVAGRTANIEGVGYFQQLSMPTDDTRLNLTTTDTVLTFTDTINLAGANPVLGITVNGMNASKIVIDGAGNAVDLGAFELAIMGANGGTAGYIPGGASITIAEGQAAPTLPGTVSGIGNGTDYTYTVDADGNNIVLNVQRLKTFDGETSGTNNKNVGAALETIGAGGNTEISSLQNRLQTAMNNGSLLQETLETLTPTVDGSIAYTTANTTNQSLGTVTDRLTELRSPSSTGTGVSSGNGSLSKNAWAQAFGRLVEQGSRKGVRGYDADTYGMALGYDAPIFNDKGRAGLAVSYARSDVDGGALYDTDIDSYQATLYGQYDLGNTGAFIEAMTAYTFSDNETVRYNIGGTGGNAYSDYRTHQYTLQGQIGKEFGFGNRFTLTPKALAHYMHYNPSDYTETGGDGLGLNVSPDSQNVFELGLGITAAKTFDTGQSGILTPSLSLGYRYDFINDTPSSTANFIGAPDVLFDTDGLDSNPHTLNIGTALNYSSNNRWGFVASYDFQHKQDYKAHAGMIKAQYKF